MLGDLSGKKKKKKTPAKPNNKPAASAASPASKSPMMTVPADGANSTKVLIGMAAILVLGSIGIWAWSKR